MANVKWLHFRTQEEDILEHSNAKCVKIGIRLITLLYWTYSTQVIRKCHEVTLMI